MDAAGEDGSHQQIGVDLDTLSFSADVRSVAPSIMNRTGEIPPASIPSGIRNPILANAPTWEQLASASIFQMLSWPHVGRHKVSRILQFAADSSGVLPPARSTLTTVDAEVRIVAAWAVAHGVSHGVDQALDCADLDGAPTSVKEAARTLRGISLVELSTAEDRQRFDPGFEAHELLSNFNERARRVLGRRLARGIRPVPTLEELGVDLGLTRQRVSQIEADVVDRVTRLLELPAYNIVADHARVLRDRIGRALPVSQLPPELIPNESGDLVNDLLLYLAGPYRIADGWLLHVDVPRDVDDIVAEAFRLADGDLVVERNALVDLMEGLGIKPHAADQLIQQSMHFHVLNDSVAKWQTVPERVRAVLTIAGRPLDFDVLIASMGDVNPSTVRNHLAVASGVKRIGKTAWALSADDGPEYRGVIDHMVEALEQGSTSLETLSVDLSQRFGVAINTVRMYATMHPRFITQREVVRLRGSSEAYVPAKSVELTADCFVIDGLWSLMLVVNRDVLRGSNRQIPEAFVAHIGVSPGERIAMTSADHVVRVGWRGIRPTVGTLRKMAIAHDVVVGDRIVLRPMSRSEIELRVVRQADLAEMTPESRLRTLVGAGPSELRLEHWLGEALGFDRGAAPTIEQLRVRLRERGERVLDDLVGDVLTLAVPP